MKYFKFLSKRILAVLVLLFANMVVFAQPDPLCDPADPTCPIDDYYFVLIAAVLIFAAFKAYKRRIAVTAA